MSSVLAPIAAFLAVALPAQQTTASGSLASPATDVFESGVGGYHTYRIPSVVRTERGTLVAFCEGRKSGRGDSGDIDMLARRSTDAGRTWGPVQTIWDDGANTCGNPCAVVDRASGTIVLLMTHNLGTDREPAIIAGTSKGTRTVWLTRSTDDGVTWSKPTEITATTKRDDWTWYATGPGAGIQLRHGPHRGRLVIPCDHIEAETKRYSSHVLLSDDAGATWRLGGSSPRDKVNECEIVELAGDPPGRLLLNMRNYDRDQRARQIAWSDDGGETWRDQRHDPTLIEPICQASLRRVRWPNDERPGVVLFSNPASTDTRERLTIRASLDDGATWPHAFVLHAGGSAYSCLVALDDDRAACLFEADGYARIVFAEVTLSTVLASPPGLRPAAETPAKRDR